MRWAIILVIMLSLTLGCSPRAGKEKITEKPERIVTVDEVYGDLPCFKCHSFQNFISPKRGTFPHPIHRDKGYHCNQCHSFKAHSFMKTNTNLCNDCHNLKVVGFSYTEMPSRFDHDKHASVGCKECHPNLFPMKKGITRISMDAIYKGSYCGACHNGKKAFSSSECSRCHEMKGFSKELRYKVEGIGDVVFSHKLHTTMFSCDHCHPKSFPMKKTKGKMTMEEINKGKYCGTCHNGSIASPASDCGKCHLIGS